MHYTRIFADERGESHYEDVSIDLAEVDFAPPAAPLLISQPIAAEKFLLCRIPEEWDGSWHPSPARQYFIVLNGVVEAEVSDGEVRRFEVGDLILLEDTAGKGHATRVPGGSEAHGMFIQLPV